MVEVVPNLGKKAKPSIFWAYFKSFYIPPSLADKSDGYIFVKSGFSEIWMFGYVENAPRHIPTFQFSDFEILKNRHFCKHVRYFGYTSPFCLV